MEQAVPVDGPVPGDLAVKLGTALRDRGYDDERELRSLLGAPAEQAVDPDQVPVAIRHAARAGGELAALARLLLLGDEVGAERARAALGQLELDELVAARVLSRAGEGVVSGLQILPYEGLLLAGDAPGRDGGREEVTLPGPSARTLAALTVRRPVGAALDLGSGGGVQGLLMATHADHVVLSDVSPRAASMASLNAHLNEIENVELRTGDWFEPVQGERFDLLAANLPYVVSPDFAYVHRDNPFERDCLARSVVERVGDHLNEGGFAHVLCSWIQGRDEVWSQVPLDWVAETGCDALILHYSSHEPLEYAASWNRPLQRSDPAAFEAALDRWLAYYAEAGIERIASGAVILRRTTQRESWTRAVEAPDAPTGMAGDHVERLFAAQDTLARLERPEALLGKRLAPAPGQRLDQTMAVREGRHAADAAFMRCRPGVGVVARVDPGVLPVMVGCDGRRALGELITRVTEGLGEERPEVATLAFHTARTAYELGLVTG